MPEGEPPPREGFRIGHTSVRPRIAFFDARREVRLRYRFRAYGPADVEVDLVRRRTGEVVRSWIERDLTPVSVHTRRWNGLTRSGRPGRGGRYKFLIGPAGKRARGKAKLRFHRHRFPVPGPHGYGDRFGVPRSGGRTHEGQDLWAACGARLVAARGGSVQAKGYSPSLYGHYLTIDGRGTDRDYFYSHLRPRVPVGRGERVRTGRRIGRVGKSGNARSEGCQLHFELWPDGWRRGGPVDPLGELRRWDAGS